MMKVASLCFEVCYPQRNALSGRKSKAKTGKIRHVSQDIRHLHEIPWSKGLWDTIRSSSEPWHKKCIFSICSPYVSYGISKENLTKYKDILSLVITFFILII